MSRSSRTLAALLTAAALTLAGCSSSGDSGEFTAVDPTTENAADTAAEKDGDYEDAGSWNEDFTQVDPARFEAHGGYIVAAWGAGLRGCGLSLDDDWANFQCAVDFSGYPPTPNGSDKTPTEDGDSIAVQYDPVYGFYPVSDRFTGNWVEGDVEELGVNETVSIGGFTISRIEEDAVLVERGAHWFTFTAGEFMPFNSAGGSIEGDLSEYDVSTSETADEGALCGFIESEDHTYSAVISMEEGTNCPIGYEVAEDYLSPNRSGGEPQGSGGFWDGPRGWSCGRGYLIPGMEDIGANKMPVCSAENMRGDAGEGAGSVAIVPTVYLG